MNRRDSRTAVQTSVPAAAQVARMQPHNYEAERALLGGCLLDNDALDKASETVKPADFYRKGHGDIFQVMLDLRDKREPVDIVSVANLLKARDLLNQIGGYGHLAELESSTPTAANILYYARIVREMALLRTLITVTNDIQTDAYSGADGVDEILDKAQAKVFEVAVNKVSSPFQKMDGLLEKTMNDLNQKADKDPQDVSGVASGFPDLDIRTSGFQEGNLVIIAARPGMGKTSFALNIAAHAAQQGHPIAIFSLEMSARELMLRILSSESRMNMMKFRRPKTIQQDEWQDLIRVMGGIARLPVHIDDSAALSVLELRARLRRLQADYGGKLGLVIVDYLQLMTAGKQVHSREQEVAYISRSLKGIAKELKLPVLALSQLSRQTESAQRGNKRPQLSDLRESGAIEQDADVVLFIYREDAYKTAEQKASEGPDARTGVAEIIIAKQRNGPTGKIELQFDGECTRFTSFEHHRQELQRTRP
ncbi:MAG: Replicative DNA helicase [Myxococcota bacterium]|nr:Replicative DNA helicase [Myxococcota bacterium]